MTRVKFIDSSQKEMFDRVCDDFTYDYFNTENVHLILVLTCCCENINHIKNELEPFYSIIDSILKQSSNITFLENCNFDF